MLTKEFIGHLNRLLNQKAGNDQEILTVRSVAGGSINSAYKLTTKSENYFLKLNSASRFPGMFESEQRGLELLMSSKTVFVPQTICTGIFETNAYLIQHFISPGQRKENYYEMLGCNLAALHKNVSHYFGLDHDNYIGSLKQYNNPHVNGADFMINERFDPLIKTAYEKNLLDKTNLSLY